MVRKGKGVVDQEEKKRRETKDKDGKMHRIVMKILSRVLQKKEEKMNKTVLKMRMDLKRIQKGKMHINRVIKGKGKGRANKKEKKGDLNINKHSWIINLMDIKNLKN